MKIKQLTLAIVIVILSFAAANAAQSGLTGMEETMYSSGKIYVVVAVVAVLLIAILGYLIRLDRRLTKHEEMKQMKP